MLRYDVLSNITLTIDLHNNFSVLAMAKWNHETEKYLLTLFIKENDIDTFNLIDEQTNVEIDADQKNIKREILKYVEKLHEQDYFDSRINELKYEFKCFDRGHMLYEKERLCK